MYNIIPYPVALSDNLQQPRSRKKLIGLGGSVLISVSRWRCSAPKPPSRYVPTCN